MNFNFFGWRPFANHEGRVTKEEPPRARTERLRESPFNLARELDEDVRYLNRAHDKGAISDDAFVQARLQDERAGRHLSRHRNF